MNSTHDYCNCHKSCSQTPCCERPCTVHYHMACTGLKRHDYSVVPNSDLEMQPLIHIWLFKQEQSYRMFFFLVRLSYLADTCRSNGFVHRLFLHIVFLSTVRSAPKMGEAGCTGKLTQNNSLAASEKKAERWRRGEDNERTAADTEKNNRQRTAVMKRLQVSAQVQRKHTNVLVKTVL